MFFDELEEFGEVPSNGVLCLLCRQKLIIRRGDLRSFEEHLRRTHAVYNNINWITKCTFHSQNRKGLLRREGGGTPPTHDGPNLSGDLSESGRSKRGRRRNQKTEGSRKKIKTIEKVSILEELEEKVEVFDFSSARIKRCDVKVKTGDFSHYLQDLGLEQIKSPDSNLRKEDTSSGLNLEDEKEEVCEETSSSSRDSVAECSQQKEVVEANPYDDDDSGEDWYYGTTFTCLVCDYQSRVLKLFEKHVEEKHGCELKKFSKKYKVDGGKYACKICGSEVRHDKSDIDSHVQSHFLSLAKYGQLYEKKLNDIVERKRLIKEKKVSGSSDVGTSQVKENLSNLSEVAAPLKKAAETGNVERIISKADYRTEVKSKEKPETVDTSSQEETDGASVEPEIFENNNKISEQPTEYLSNLADKDHISFTIAEVNEVIHDMLTEEAEKSKSLGPPPLTPPPRPPPAVLESELLKSPFPKSDDEIYIYCCPFQDCHYTCNFQHVKQGPAATHCLEEHNTDPWQFKLKGLKWKRVSLTSQMEKIFDG